jgi:hypothetical protein
MDYEREIRDLKAALLETKTAVAGLGLCIAQTLVACYPKSKAILTNNLRNWLGQSEFRGQTHSQEIALIFGRAFVEPSFPMSYEPPDNGN